MPRLTARAVARHKPKPRPYEVSCSTLRGFMLRVLPSGKKVYYARVPAGGEYRRVRIGLASMIEFSSARQRAVDLITSGASPPPARAASVPTVREFAARYDAGHISTHVKPSTQRRYRQLLRGHLLPEFGAKRLDEIHLEDVEKFHAARATRPMSANNAVRLLSNIYTKAIDWRVLPRYYVRPTRGVRLYKQRRRERFMTAAERRRLERVLDRALSLKGANAPGRLHWSIVALIRLLALTGMRRAEALGLTWDMVDRRHRCLRLPDSKTGPKIVPISQPVLELLDRLERRRDPTIPFVAYSRMKTRVSAKGLGEAWIRVRKAARLGDMRLHDLRHSAASDALMAGVPLAVVGRILGHRSPRTTARYAHLSDEVVKSGVEAMGAAIAGRHPPKLDR